MRKEEGLRRAVTPGMGEGKAQSTTKSAAGPDRDCGGDNERGSSYAKASQRKSAPAETWR